MSRSNGNAKGDNRKMRNLNAAFLSIVNLLVHVNFVCFVFFLMAVFIKRRVALPTRLKMTRQCRGHKQ
jgi:hypothetical protein